MQWRVILARRCHTTRLPMNHSPDSDSIHEKASRIRELEAQIAELKKRWPAHSTPPALMDQLDELEAELENERARFSDLS